MDLTQIQKNLKRNIVLSDIIKKRRIEELEGQETFDRKLVEI